LNQPTLKVVHASWKGATKYSIKEFEELFKIKYLPHITFADYTIEKWIHKKCRRALHQDKISDFAKWLGKLHAKELDEARIPAVSLRWIDETIGYGLYTDEPIKKWSFVGEYTGILRARSRFVSNVNDYCFMYPSLWLSYRALTIDGKDAGNFTRFMNHSDNPNVESVSVFHGGIFRMIFRALEDIPAGTELSFNYGNPYWTKKKKLERK